MERLLGSSDVIAFPTRFKLLNRGNRGKFSNRVNRLSLKSIVSKASLVTAKCSMAGMASPRNTSSRSPSGLGRCSAWLNISADNLIFADYFTAQRVETFLVELICLERRIQTLIAP